MEKDKCKEHGEIETYMQIEVKKETYKKVCLQCWADKVTEGLKDYK